jgi:hypothetical protein
MARKKAPSGAAVLSGRDAAMIRQKNAEKQKRFRENMKGNGFKEVKAWEKPPPPGWVKAWAKCPVPLIRESTAGVCERDIKTRQAVDGMLTAFFTAMRGENDNMSNAAWDIYKDIETLLSPLGYRAV